MTLFLPICKKRVYTTHENARQPCSPSWPRCPPSALRCMVSRGPMNAYRRPRPSDMTRSRSPGDTIPACVEETGRHVGESLDRRLQDHDFTPRSREQGPQSPGRLSRSRQEKPCRRSGSWEGRFMRNGQVLIGVPAAVLPWPEADSLSLLCPCSVPLSDLRHRSFGGGDQWGAPEEQGKRVLTRA